MNFHRSSSYTSFSQVNLTGITIFGFKTEKVNKFLSEKDITNILLPQEQKLKVQVLSKERYPTSKISFRLVYTSSN